MVASAKFTKRKPRTKKADPAAGPAVEPGGMYR